MKTADTDYYSFERSYAGFSVTQAISARGVSYTAWHGGYSSSTTTDKNILNGTTIHDLGSDLTASGIDRFDANETANITIQVVRNSATDFRLDHILDIIGGSGPQTFSSNYFAPSGDYFQLGDAFTTFAIGFHNSMDNGSSLDITNLTVSTIPEPTAWALLAGSLTVLMIFRRHRA